MARKTKTRFIHEQIVWYFECSMARKMIYYKQLQVLKSRNRMKTIVNNAKGIKFRHSNVLCGFWHWLVYFKHVTWHWLIDTFYLSGISNKLRRKSEYSM